MVDQNCAVKTALYTNIKIRYLSRRNIRPDALYPSIAEEAEYQRSYTLGGGLVTLLEARAHQPGQHVRSKTSIQCGIYYVTRGEEWG